MKGLRTPQRMVPVRVLVEDGHMLEGGLYVPATGADGGPGRLLDRLNDDTQAFLPLAGRHETLLNKSRIVTVQLASGHERPEGITEQHAREQRVRFHLAGGYVVDGWVRYFMPDEHARLLDYLNECPRFIPVIGDQRVTLVHRLFVSSVEELSGTSSVK